MTSTADGPPAPGGLKRRSKDACPGAEPEQAFYTVEVFQKASENDMRPEPNTQEFAEYCESAGWKFMDAKQKFCIFKKIEQEAVELFTPDERVNNALKGTFFGICNCIIDIIWFECVIEMGLFK